MNAIHIYHDVLIGKNEHQFVWYTKAKWFHLMNSHFIQTFVHMKRKRKMVHPTKILVVQIGMPKLSSEAIKSSENQRSIVFRFDANTKMCVRLFLLRSFSAYKTKFNILFPCVDVSNFFLLQSLISDFRFLFMWFDFRSTINA